MPTYGYTASQCPSIPTPTTGQQNPASGSPLVGDTIATGESVQLRPKLNQNSVRGEMLGRHGGGVYAVQTGCNLSIGSGLNVSVAAGQVVIDGPRFVAAQDVAVSNGIALGSIWCTQAGALVSASNLTAPAGNVCLLGLYTSAGGAVTAVDESGVLRLDQGNLAMRQTADTTVPTDTPPAGVRFLTKCPGGLYLWDGVEYWTIGGDQTGLLPSLIATGETFTIPANRQAIMLKLQVDGSLVVNGDLRIIGET